MAVHGKKTRFWLAAVADLEAPVDISTKLNEVGFPRSKDEVETTTFGTEEKTFIPGYKDKTINLSGRFDPDIDAQMDALYNQDDEIAFFHYPAGRDVSGNPTPAMPEYSGNVVLLGYDTSSTVGDVTGFTATLRITGGVTRSIA